jgi:hypothetical protein
MIFAIPKPAETAAQPVTFIVVFLKFAPVQANTRARGATVY